ncbi:MAG: site-specific integrase [Oscillospiraceae bacterium]|nr:site-specific integrase [Oscillospiraceae bacterium]
MKRRTKGEGTIRKRSDGRWEGRYIDSSGRTRYIYDTNKSKIREKLTEMSYIKDITIFNKVGGDVPLNIWFEHYIEIKEYQIKKRSVSQIKMAFHNHIEPDHIEPVIGKKILFDITMNDIISVIKSLERKKLNPCTINNITTHMRAMFNFAYAEGSIARNPMLTLKRLEKESNNKRRPLTRTEISLLLTSAEKYDKSFHLILCILLYTGIRIGELCGLRWNDISEDFSSMQINESITDKVYENTTKSKTSVRQIPLNGFLKQALKERYESLPDEKRKPNDWIFLNRFGTSYTSTTLNKRLKYLKTHMREEEHINIDPDITMHYFRHTFTCAGLENGVSIKAMQELLGHANTRTLLEVYAHTNHKSRNRIDKPFK